MNVTIGDNSVIGAGSIVNNNVPANVLAVGNPLKVIKDFIVKFLINILRQLVLGPLIFTHLVLIKKSKHWRQKVLDYKNEKKVLKNYITKSDIITAGEGHM